MFVHLNTYSVTIPCDTITLHEYQSTTLGPYAGDPAIAIRTDNSETVEFPPMTKQCQAQVALWRNRELMFRTEAYDLNRGDIFSIELPMRLTIS